MSEMNAFEAATMNTPVEAPESGSATPAPAASPTQGSTPGTDQTVEIKWNGRTERVPLSKAVELAQKGYDYTQKMQQLAREREEFGSQRERYTQYETAMRELREFLGDPSRVEAYLQELRRRSGGGGASQPPADPDEVLTHAELQKRLEAARAELQGYTQQQLAEMRTQIEVETLAGQYTQELDSQIKALTQKMPELKAIPKIEWILKEDVRLMGPRSIAEAKQMMVDVAQGHAERVRQFTRGQAQAQPQPSTSPALTKGIEPRGGGVPAPPANPLKFKSFNDPAFKDVVMRELIEASSRRNQ